MILLIGYGNPLCGDDGIGPYAVEQLYAGDPSNANAQYCAVRQLTPELAELISKVEAVVFVDASDSNATGEMPGQMTCSEIERYPTQSELSSGPFTHHVNP